MQMDSIMPVIENATGASLHIQKAVGKIQPLQAEFNDFVQ